MNTQQIASYWNIHHITYRYKNKDLQIRAGFIDADSSVPFKGNVIYYQGLSDSMLNHDPFFIALAHAGYRVITFDYMGQGGSDGSMNYTTMEHINNIGDMVWERFARQGDNENSRQMNIIGWSAGGLAAYRRAYISKQNEVRAVVLVAPAVGVSPLIGERLKSFPPNKISYRTLISHYDGSKKDFYVDPIKPNNPLKVPLFAINIMKDSLIACANWVISPDIKGYVFHCGKDTFAHPKKTDKTIRKNAGHFLQKTFPNSFHQLDNEVPEISHAFRDEVIRFLA